MADKKDLTALVNLKAMEVSLVDAGANLKKRFPVFKQKESSMNEEILKMVLQTEVDEEARLEDWISKAKLSDKGKEAIKGALRLLSGYKDELPGDALEKLAEAAGYSTPKAKEQTKKGCGDGEDESPLPEEGKQTMKKALDDPEFAAVFKAQQDELTALKSVNENVTKALKVEKDKRELNEWTQKAREDLSHFPGKSSEELGVMLKALSDQNPESAKAQFELLKQASEAMKTSAILKEAGQFGGDSKPTSAWVEVELIAKELVQKSTDRDFTKEKAIDLVLQRDPDLYNRYLKENPAQCGGRN